MSRLQFSTDLHSNFNIWILSTFVNKIYKSDNQIVKEIYNKGMLLYKPLLDKSPNKEGKYDNYKNNVQKLNTILHTLHYINRDFVAHIDVDKNTKSTEKYEKIKKINRPYTKARIYHLSKQKLTECTDLQIKKESKKIPKLKGIRRFSFLPIKAGFDLNYANISPSLVKEMRTTSNAFGQEPFFMPLLRNFQGDSRNRCDIKKVFSRDNNELFNFNIKQLRPTFNKGFEVKSINTDGVGCSILFQLTAEAKKLLKKQEEAKKAALNKAKKAHDDAQKTEAKAFKEAMKKRELEMKKFKKSRKNSDSNDPNVEIKSDSFIAKPFDEFELLKAKLRSNPILGLDPGVKSLYTAYCVDSNRLDKLFDDVIKMAVNMEDGQENKQKLPGFHSYESKKQKRRRKKRKKKKWKKVKASRKNHKTQNSVIPSDLPVPLDKVKNMELTFSYSSKQ